ncbi:MAG: amidohydrolase family protein [Firmicutes bacterium]|nr:amidohydrolase family protein [Bacillota bacterium]
MIYTANTVLPISSLPIKRGAILVRNGFITAVGDIDSLLDDNQEEEVIDFGSAIIMPGLVNLHGHLECSSFDFLARPTPFSEWLGGIIEAGRSMTRDGWLTAARKGVQKYLESGITCTADITRTGLGLQAVAEVGLPSVIYIEAVGIDERNLKDAVVDLFEKIKSSESIIEADNFQLGLSPHSPYTLSRSALQVCAGIARDYDLPITVHLAETQPEVELIRDGTGSLASAISKRLELEIIRDGGSGVTPAQFLADSGLVNESLIAAHGVWLSDDDIELLGSSGVAVAVCPTSNELLGSGEAPIHKFVEHGLRFGIGTDSLASNPDLDLFAEARKVFAIYEKQTGGGAGQPGLCAEQLVKMITLEAAAILGLDDRLGSIEPGKRADFIAIEHIAESTTDLYTYIIEEASKYSISHTILGGKIVYSR